MFRRRQHEEPEEAARERERRALFAELAKRPDTVCPFLGLAGARAAYHHEATPEHRCYAFSDPSDLSSEQQERVCLQRGYGNCPRYLRGVLVIPTEELQALRRSQAAASLDAPSAPPKVSLPSDRPRRRLPAAAVAVAFLLLIGGAAAGFVILRNSGTAVVPTPTPSPTMTAVPTPAPSASATGSLPSATATPGFETPVPEPTPKPGDEFIGYEVTVLQGDNVLFSVGPDGTILGTRGATFSRFSKAPVDRIVASDGLLYWRTSVGEYTGWSYIKDRSGPFLIRGVYRGSDGATRYSILPDSEV